MARKAKVLSIHDAAARGKVFRVSECVAREQVDVEAVDNEGLTPLHLAVRAGHLKVVKVLLQAGANVNCRTILKNLTPLHMAASRGHNAMPEVVAALIEAGADRTAVDELGCAPLHQAVLTKCEGSFLALVRGCGSEVNAIDNRGESALTLAIFEKRLSVVQGLLSAGADCSIANDNGGTGLHLAAGLGHHVILKAILMAPTTNVNARTVSGVTPLMLATKRGQIQAVVQLLSHKAHVNAVDELGQTALILACSKRRHNQGVIKALLAAGADVGARKPLSWTALHLAAAKDQEETASRLIAKGADATGRNDWGTRMSPLHLAANNGALSTARLLLSAGAMATVPDSAFCSPLHYAASGGHATIIEHMLKSLEKKDVDSDGRPKDSMDHQQPGPPPQGGGSTPKRLRRNDQESQVQTVVIQKTIPTSRGRVNVCAAPGHGDLLATNNELRGCLKIPQDKGTSSELEQEPGGASSALTERVNSVTKALDARDIDGMAPLHLSAGFGHKEATRVLLLSGANEYATSKWGETPYDIIGVWVTLEHREPRTEDLIRQMLLQAPAFRACSWLWPTSANGSSHDPKQSAVAIVVRCSNQRTFSVCLFRPQKKAMKESKMHLGAAICNWGGRADPPWRG